jgi:hypothetical protein
MGSNGRGLPFHKTKQLTSSRRSVRRERFLQLASRPEGPCASSPQASARSLRPTHALEGARVRLTDSRDDDPKFERRSGGGASRAASGSLHRRSMLIYLKQAKSVPDRKNLIFDQGRFVVRSVRRSKLTSRCSRRSSVIIYLGGGAVFGGYTVLFVPRILRLSLMRWASAFVYIRLLWPRVVFSLAAISARLGAPGAGFTLPPTGPEPANTDVPQSRLVLAAGRLDWAGIRPSGTSAVPTAAPL